jgi:type I restriction enzyme R subunit
MPGRHKEIAVEASSEQHLLAAGGYVKDDRNAFDRARALDAGVFLSFIRETQPKE